MFIFCGLGFEVVVLADDLVDKSSSSGLMALLVTVTLLLELELMVLRGVIYLC